MANGSETEIVAGGLSRPLLLTPAQDLAGYIFRQVGKALLLGITGLSVLAVFVIFFFILKEAAGFISLAHIKELLISDQWYPEATPHQFGGLALIAGSLYVTAGALVLAVPTGLLAAVFLSDIAPFGLRQIIKPIIELLAAIPSVAYGFFAILVLAPWLQDNLGVPTGANALNASIILAIMAIPTIVSVSEDALSAIGRDLRAGSYALGANRAETIVKVVMPAASRGIVAAVLLGMMRAIGETMVVWMASGNAAQIPTPWWNITQSVRTLTATIAGNMGETVQGSTHYYALFSLGALLLAFTFIINLAGELCLSKRGKGK